MNDAYQFTAQYPAAEVLRELLRKDTQNPPGNERTIVEYIVKRLSASGKTPEQKVICHGENRASLIVRIAGKESEDAIAFLGHLDTVPVGKEDDWNYSPLGGAMADGNYMYGRGANDMKSGLVSMLIVLEYYLEKNRIPDKDIFFVFTADEECDGKGITEVRKSGMLRHVNRIFVAEPTGGKIGITEKGMMWIELTANGRQAHGAAPEKGINPIEFLSRFIYEWKKQISNGYGKGLEHVSVSPTVFNSGNKNNVIPATATAVLDIRTQELSQHKILLETLASMAAEMKKRAGVIIRYKILSERTPLSMDQNNLFIGQIADVIRRSGREPVCVNIPYYTDLAILLKERKVDFAILGPGDETDMHTVNEKVDVHKIKQLADIYLEYLKTYNENHVWQ